MESQQQPKTVTLPATDVVAKPWYVSKTMIVNIGIIVIVVLKVIYTSGQITDPDLLAIVASIINLLLRLTTTQPVSPKL